MCMFTKEICYHLICAKVVKTQFDSDCLYRHDAGNTN